MKKCVVLLLLAMILCGCSAGTFETVDDELVQSVMQPVYKLELALEENAMAISCDTGTIYLCDGYEVTVQVFSSGNIDATLRKITGFGESCLTVIETVADDMHKFECVWTAAGETGDVAARCVVYDDGQHHYCVTVMADAQDAAALGPAWDGIFGSVTFS